MEKELIKKQVVVYLYYYFYFGFMMVYGVNLYYYYILFNYVRYVFMIFVYFCKSICIKFWVVYEGYVRNNFINVVLQLYYNFVLFKEWIILFFNSI